MQSTLKRQCRPRLVHLLLTLGALCLAGAPATVAAQNVAEAPTSGTMTGTVNGEETEWRTVVLTTPDGEQNTASFTRMEMGPLTLFDFTLQGHQGNDYVKHALALSFGVFDEADLADCPCTIGDATATYWTTDSMFGQLYAGPVSLVIEAATKHADDHYSLEGTFAGSLVYMESAGNVDEDDLLEVDVSFGIERVDAEDLDLGS